MKGKGIEVFQNLEPLLDSMSSSMEVFYNLKPVFDDMKDSKFLKGVKEFGDTIKTMAKSNIQGQALEMVFMLLEPFLELFSLLEPIFSALGAIIMELLLPAFRFLAPIISVITQGIMQFKGVIQLLIPLIFILLGVFGILSWPIVAIVAAITVLMLIFQHWETIVKVFGIAFQWVWNAIITGLKFVANGFIWFINAIIGGINLLMNALTLGLWGDIPTIPYLAKGGLVMNPTVANISEKEPEAVIPLSKMSNMMGNDEMLRDIHNTLEDIRVISRRQLVMGRRRFG